MGLVIGVIDVLLMIPMAFPDKRAAMLGAFFAPIRAPRSGKFVTEFPTRDTSAAT